MHEKVQKQARGHYLSQMLSKLHFKIQVYRTYKILEIHNLRKKTIHKREEPAQYL